MHAHFEGLSKHLFKFNVFFLSLMGWFLLGEFNLLITSICRALNQLVEYLVILDHGRGVVKYFWLDNGIVHVDAGTLV